MRIYILFFALCFSRPALPQTINQNVRTLIVIFDGLRPDYITAENMPNLYALKNRGSYVDSNHSVFPTVTRVNASSYATGSYPASHGLMGNTVYFPEVDSLHVLNTGDQKVLKRISEATGGHLLTAVSLGEVLTNTGSRMMVFSSGSSGQAFLQNHTVGSGAVVHPEIILPQTLQEDVYKNLGKPPASDEPNVGQHAWVTRAFIHYGLVDSGPLVSAIWYSDPDGTAHANGIGSASAMKSIREVDEQLGIIVKEVERRKLSDRFNVIVTADHGFATQKGEMSIQKFLLQQGLKKGTESDDIIVAGNAIYVKDQNRDLIKKIITSLQEQRWVGAIFTKPAAHDPLNGWVEGTLSFKTIHWDHERAGDILVDYNWDDDPNEHGYKGSSFAPGVAGHGGASPFEIHIPLIASGPAFARKHVSSIPTSNVDIVPTILHYYGIPAPPSMQGRVLEEILADGGKSKPVTTKQELLESSVAHEWGTYKVTLRRSVVGDQRYVDFAKVERTLFVKK